MKNNKFCKKNPIHPYMDLEDRKKGLYKTICLVCKRCPVGEHFSHDMDICEDCHKRPYTHDESGIDGVFSMVCDKCL